MTQNPKRLVGGAIFAAANVFYGAALLWGPPRVPVWIEVPYFAAAITFVVLVLMARQEGKSNPAAR
jgi:hypothetical protein